MNIAIVNSSTIISDNDGRCIVGGLNMILPQFCSDWGLPTYTATYVPKQKTTTIPLKVFILDSSDVKGAFGYHELSENVPYGKCFAKTILSCGGKVLYTTIPKTPTLSRTVCHEVFELLTDPNCNSWWDIGDKQNLVARETCDPVQRNLVNVVVEIFPATTTFNPITRKTVTTPAITANVTLSDWILPAWANPQNTVGPFNHNNTLKKPFEIDSGGYLITLSSGQSGQITSVQFGVDVTEEEKSKYMGNGVIIRRKI